MINYIKTWFRDFRDIFTKEFKGIFTDGGVLLIFFVGGMGYPLLYNALYYNGVVADTPVAVVDMSGSEYSRRYIREVDATRELAVVAKCTSMEEAQELMKQRKVNGILYFPSDFGDKIIRHETAKLSIYADMSSFIYYKNLLMGSNFVMLDEIHKLQISQVDPPVLYEENNPYNNAFSYTIFFLSAALLLVVQQTMFYGMCLRAGTMREEKIGILHGGQYAMKYGMGRVVLGRGAAYWLPYIGIAMYIAFVVPALFGFPQRGNFSDIFVMLLFFVTDCVLCCEFWSSFFQRRETVIVLLLFVSPIAMFLTGFSWPTSAIPTHLQWISYLFPSTFGCKAYINLNSAGGNLSTVHELIRYMSIQGCIYYLASNLMVYLEVNKKH